MIWRDNEKWNNPTILQEQQQGAVIVSRSDKFGLLWQKQSSHWLQNMYNPQRKHAVLYATVGFFFFLVQLLPEKGEDQMCCLNVFKTLLVKA